MMFFKIAGICVSVFLLFSCGSGDNTRTGDDGDGSPRGEREIDRLKRDDLVIEAFLDRRFDGGYYYDSYTGEKCEEDSRCRYICENQVISKAKRRCLRAPKALVEDLDDGFYKLININDTDSVDISPALLAGMLDIHVDLVSKLIARKMSEGDIKSFLAWVALNEDISQVFYQEDRRVSALKEAFERLGDFQDDTSRETATGLNIGLITEEDSFFYLAAVEDNKAGFKTAYKVLRSICRTRECKMDILCARKIDQDGRSRLRRTRHSRYAQCRTSSEHRNRDRRNAVCYIHGSVVWAYIDELIEEKELKAREFLDNPVSVGSCNAHCGARDSGKCPIVY